MNSENPKLVSLRCEASDDSDSSEWKFVAKLAHPQDSPDLCPHVTVILVTKTQDDFTDLILTTFNEIMYEEREDGEHRPNRGSGARNLTNDREHGQ
jgi:hypothetical protein